MECKEMLFRLEEDWQNYLENKGKLTCEDMMLIKELVDKETPKKPLYIKERIEIGIFLNYMKYLIGRCPKCNASVSQNKTYCYECGQHLDWSD